MPGTLLVVGKDPELVALGAQPLDGAGKGSLEFVNGAQGVVEGDDAAWTSVAFNIIEDIVGGEPSGVVARHEVPHNDGKFLAQV